MDSTGLHPSSPMFHPLSCSLPTPISTHGNDYYSTINRRNVFSCATFIFSQTGGGQRQLCSLSLFWCHDKRKQKMQHANEFQIVEVKRKSLMLSLFIAHFTNSTSFVLSVCFLPTASCLVLSLSYLQRFFFFLLLPLHFLID